MRSVNECVSEVLNSFSDAMSDIPPGDIGVAVSGGSDSTALLSLSSEWARLKGRKVISATVDHGLRIASAFECQEVKKTSIQMEVDHTTIKWSGKPRGNLQNAARNARHRLLKRWANKNNLSIVLLGHTLDDNAETVMLRLIRGSGVDGLSGISKRKTINGFKVFRPLLFLRRAHLQEYLRYRGLPWIEDPSNSDSRFDRVRIRKLLSDVNTFGLTSQKLTLVAEHMCRAKEALNSCVMEFAKSDISQTSWGDFEISLCRFLECSEEVQFRVLSSILRWNSGKKYNPRFGSLRKIHSEIKDSKLGARRSLMGSLIRIKADKIIVSREFSAIPKPKIIKKQVFVWDNRWKIRVNPSKVNLGFIGPLGNNRSAKVMKFLDSSIPKSALSCVPAMFEGDEVICVPILSYGTAFTSQLADGDSSFLNFLARC